MAKILIGLVAAIAVAVAGFFGFGFYMQHRVAGDVEAAFDQIRATGSKASHGKVSFDLWSRTVTIADIASELTAQPPLSVKIASFTASGVSQPDATRFSADTIEASGVEVGATMADQPGWRLSYKAAKDHNKRLFRTREACSGSRLRRRPSTCTDSRWSNWPPSPRPRSPHPVWQGP